MVGYKVERNETGFTVTNPKGVSYEVTKKGATFKCSCPGYTHRGVCRHLQMIPRVERRFTRAFADRVLAAWAPTFERMCTRWEIAGSYRRGKDTVKDLDILLECSAETLYDLGVDLKDCPDVQVEMSGKDILRFWVPQDGEMFEIDVLRVRSPAEWAPYLLYRTGSAEHNIQMRGLAKALGFKLSERGLFNRETGEQIPTPTEESVFAALGLRYLEPAARR